MAVKDVNDASFEEEVLKSKTPVAVDIWATWCGPCRIFSPVFEDLSKDFEGKVKFVKLDADQNEKTTVKYNVMSIPTTLLIVNGKTKAMNVGAVPKETLKKWIEKNI
jgi:thioredoxin 1